jgi:hypothetical protein
VFGAMGGNVDVDQIALSISTNEGGEHGHSHIYQSRWR